ncbi:MAG: M48 family metalloprotease [Acidimicrobiales bacterium]
MADDQNASRPGPAKPGSGGSSSGRGRRRSRGRGRGGSGGAQGTRKAAPSSSGQRAQGSPGRRPQQAQRRRNGPPRTGDRQAGTAVPAVVEPAVALAVVPERDDPLGAAPANRRRAVLVAVSPAALVLVLGTVVGVAVQSVVGGLAAGAALGLLVFTSLWRGGCRALLRSHGARRVDEDDVPGPYNLVEGLCATMGLSVPALYLVDDPAPNALALGRGAKDASLVLTTGLLAALDPVTLEGVLAHELTHIKRDDTAPATLAAAIYLVIGVVVPGGPSAVHALAGRGRELHTDRQAVRVTRYPPGLRHALAVLSGEEGAVAASATGTRRVGQLTRWLWTAVLPDTDGSRPTGDALVGELDTPSVRICALDEW